VTEIREEMSADERTLSTLTSKIVWPFFHEKNYLFSVFNVKKNLEILENQLF
jgi:hypothetical protein